MNSDFSRANGWSTRVNPVLNGWSGDRPNIVVSVGECTWAPSLGLYPRAARRGSRLIADNQLQPTVTCVTCHPIFWRWWDTHKMLPHRFWNGKWPVIMAARFIALKADGCQNLKAPKTLDRMLFQQQLREVIPSSNPKAAPTLMRRPWLAIVPQRVLSMKVQDVVTLSAGTNTACRGLRVSVQCKRWWQSSWRRAVQSKCCSTRLKRRCFENWLKPNWTYIQS